MGYKIPKCLACGRIMVNVGEWTSADNDRWRHVSEGMVRVVWECKLCGAMKITERKIGTWKYPTEEYRKKEAERLREYRRRIKAEITEKRGT